MCPLGRPGDARSRPKITASATTLLEAVASSLTELFSPQIIGERVEACSEL
jgi:hypothetical protein